MVPGGTYADLMKEVDETFKFDVGIKFDVKNEAPHHHQYQHPQQRPPNNVRCSQERFGNVREDLLLMKNELNALKKDLSSAKKGLESDKKPLMVRIFDGIWPTFQSYLKIAQQSPLLKSW